MSNNIKLSLALGHRRRESTILADRLTPLGNKNNIKAEPDIKPTSSVTIGTTFGDQTISNSPIKL